MSFSTFLKSKRLLGTFALLITASSLFFGLPQRTHATGIVFDPVNNVSNVGTSFSTGGILAKEYGFDTAAWFLANTILKKMTASTVNWINSGFNGAPSFVTNPGQFFLDAGDQTASNILNGANLNQLCSPFKAEVRLALVQNYLAETDSSATYACTLDRLKDNFEQFTDDFNQGGWDGWFEITQNQQNNPYGAYLDAKNQLDLQVGTQQTKYQAQLQQGNGFLSFEQCPKGQTVTEAQAEQWNADIDSQISGGDATANSGGYWKAGDCAVQKTTVTPGKVLETQLNSALGTGKNRLEVSDEIGEIIGALFSQLMNKVLGGVGGLLGASEKDASGKSFLDQLTAEKEKSNQNTDKYITCTSDPDTVDSDGNTIPGQMTCDPVKQPTPSIDPSMLPPGCTLSSDGESMTCDGTNSTPPGTTGGSCGPGNDGGTAVPPAIAQDMSNVVIDGYNVNVSGWPISSSVTLDSVTFPDGTSPTGDFCLNHPMPWAWPAQTSFASDVPANGWVFVWRGGSWHAATFEYYYATGSGAECRVMDSVWNNAAISGGFSPKPGETYGFMLSGIARGAGATGTAQERSNIQMVKWAGAQCTGTGSTTNPPGTTTPPPPGSTNQQAPVISSLTLTTIYDAARFTILGTNLLNTSTGAANVTFIYGNGLRSTVPGTPSSDGTQIVVTAPTGLTGTSGYVQVDNGAGLVSNAYPIAIAQKLDIPTTIPTSVFVPTTTIVVNGRDVMDGWWPHLSPDGRFVAYGDWQASFVTDMQTGANYNFYTPPDLIGTNPSCLGGQWIGPRKLTYICTTDILPRDNAYRYEVDFSTGVPGTPVRMSDDTALASGNEFVAKDGHWATYAVFVQQNYSRIAKDNKILVSPTGGGISISGDDLASACDNSNSQICVRTGTALSRRLTPKVPLFGLNILDGYVMYGGYGPVHGISPAGTDIDLRLSPKLSEGVGKIVKVNGIYWAVTPAWGAGGDALILLRPWGSASKQAIAIDAAAVYVDVVVVGNNFVIAYNGDTGQMAVKTVPINSPLTTIPQ